MKQFLYLLSLIILIIWISGCDHSPKSEAKRIVKKWIGKEIVVPDHDLTYKVMGRDTACSDLWNKPYKVFVYIDSIGCISCRLGLSQWKEIIDSSRITYPDMGFLFVIHAVSYRKFEWELKDAEFDYPVIYDYRDEFYKLNHFPPDPYRSYLLDKNNKVVVIGSPAHNPKIWELYKQVFARQN